MNLKEEDFTKSKTWFIDRINSLKRYTSKQELDALLVEDDKPIFDILEALSDIKAINELDAFALIFKLRESSVSDLIELTKPCQKCNFMNIYNIEIDEFFDLDFERDNDIPLGLFTSLDDIINTKTQDDLILKDYLKLREEVMKNTEQLFKPYVKRTCQKCRTEEEIYVHPKHIISKSNASAIFKEYTDISYYSNNGKLDIDAMYPFHREIVISLINENQKATNSQLPKGL